jgi:hypothetical protein
VATVHRSLKPLRAAMNWSMAQTPPLVAVPSVRRRMNKKLETTRDRRMTRDEEKQLLVTALETMNTPEEQVVGPLLDDRIIGAIELVCRRGEMLLIQNRRVNWETCQIGTPGATTKDIDALTATRTWAECRKACICMDEQPTCIHQTTSGLRRSSTWSKRPLTPQAQQSLSFGTAMRIAIITRRGSLGGHMDAKREAFAAAVLVALFCAASVGTTSAQVPLDQRATARQLLSDDANEQRRAFAAAGTIPVQEMTPEFRAALIALLEQKNAIVVRAAARGIPLSTVEDPEFVSSVSRKVAELRDRRAIPALAQAIYGGDTAARALAAFGDASVSPVARVVTSPTSHYNSVDFGLTVLRLLVEQSRVQPLSPTARDESRRAALDRLTGPEYFTSLWRAIDLAVALEDPELVGIVSSLAYDQRALAARGLTDPEIVERTHARARDRLSGVEVK